MRHGESPLVEGVVWCEDMGRLWAQQEMNPLVKRPGDLGITQKHGVRHHHICAPYTVCFKLTHLHKWHTAWQHVGKNSVTVSGVYINYLGLNKHVHVSNNNISCTFHTECCGVAIFPRFKMLIWNKLNQTALALWLSLVHFDIVCVRNNMVPTSLPVKPTGNSPDTTQDLSEICVRNSSEPCHTCLLGVLCPWTLYVKQHRIYFPIRVCFWNSVENGEITYETGWHTNTVEGNVL